MAAAGDAEQEEREISAMAGMSRKEKRKALKKLKRKKLRREKAIIEREEEEAWLKNPEEQMRLLRLEQEEKERLERDRLEFEERERKFLQELEMTKKKEEEEEQRKIVEVSQSNLVDNENANELNEDDEWEYVEEGPAEIIWKGNEIIVKKKKVRVPKKDPIQQKEKQESERPISNPLAPQSQAFEDYRSAQEVLESVAQQVPNFGTEQDKAHCPFHLKTGVCRFGARCSRVHFYPDKSCTLLMKNMYSGPGLAWEQDEGLEYTDEEVERYFEDFYEDVHTEFLKFGELVNFKVCKNASSHLRGNVYVHYKMLESAVLAYQSINGRYFAGKQISCEFINVTRWKVAICGEYMKSRLKTCSRGSACNFIHCFRNPAGDYEWADWDKPAPRYWLKKMAALFGCTTDRLADEISPRYHPRRSRSRGSDSGDHSDEEDDRKRGSRWRRRGDNRGTSKSSQDNHHSKHRKSDYVDMSDEDSDDRKFLTCTMRSSRDRKRDHELTRHGSKSRRHETYSDKYRCSKRGEGNGKHNNFDFRGSPHSDRHCDKQHRHKDKHSLPRKNRADSSDIDSHRYRLDRDEDRCRKRSKTSSRKRENETELSDNGSHGGSLGSDEKSPRKSKRKNSRSKSELTDADSNRERCDREEEYHRHGRRSSRHHSKDKLGKVDSSAYRCSVDSDNPRETNSDADLDRSLSEKDKVDDILDFQKDNNLSRYADGDKYHDRCNEGRESERHHKRYDVESRSEIKRNQGTTASHKVEGGDRHTSSNDAYRQPEDEHEKAYRLAALKKLEEMRKSKDTPVENRDDIEITEIHSHENIFESTEVGKDMEQLSGTSKVDRNATTRKRRRI